MANSEVGQVSLGVQLDSGGLAKQITSLAKSAGKMLVGAFATKSLIDFGKSCIDLGSDLTEVQNVVDSAFHTMSGSVDEFAQNAATQFGLSETMAKRYAGTFGAMAQAFGFTEGAAVDMSTTLTGLAGDVASFYNITQDEAYTKLKSVFTGETESLKDLGVVMSQTALDSYALANGFGKTTSQMSEMEKVALRYQFVQDQLSTATGDFARTAGTSWANQVRIFTLQMDSLKATIGQGLINAFMPVIKAVNTLIGRLAILANAFKSFTEMIFGDATSDDNAAQKAITDLTSTANEGLSDASDAASSLSDSTSAAGDAAKKAAKEMRQLMGFDQINKLSDSTDDSSDSSSSPDASGVGGEIDFGNLSSGSSVLDEINEEASTLLTTFKQLAEQFKKGFEIGFGNSFDTVAKLKTHIASIKDTLKEIFTDQAVVDSANGFLESIVLNLGKIVGSVASIGVSIADSIVGGFDYYLQDNEGYIKESLVQSFDLSSDLVDLAGDLSVAVATVFESLASEGGERLAGGLIGTFCNTVMGMFNTVLMTIYAILTPILQPFIDNAEKIKEVFSSTFDAIAPLLEGIAQGVADFYEGLYGLYEDVIKPVVDVIAEALSGALGSFLDWLKDIFDWVGQNNNAAQENGEIIGFVIGAISAAIAVVTTINALMSIAAAIQTGLTVITTALGAAFAFLTSPITLVVAAIAAVITIGVLLYKNWDTISTKAKEIWGGIKDFFEKTIDGIATFFKGLWSGIKETFSSVGSWFKSIFQTAWKNIKSVFSGVGSFFGGIWETIKSKFTNIGTKIGESVAGAFKSSVNSVFTTIENIVNGFINTINGAIDIVNKVPGVSIGHIATVSLPRLAQGGYVKANTPQLAMIGDNKTQGEIVAPEGKLLEMARLAARESGGNEEMIGLLRQILQYLKSTDMVTIDPEALRKYMIKKTNQNTKATGVCELVY